MDDDVMMEGEETTLVSFTVVHWQFVVGYMTNCGSISLDGVVTMLNMMLSDDPVSEKDTKVWPL